MENGRSIIPIDIKWEIFFDQSSEKKFMPLPPSVKKYSANPLLRPKIWRPPCCLVQKYLAAPIVSSGLTSDVL